MIILKKILKILLKIACIFLEKTFFGNLVLQKNGNVAMRNVTYIKYNCVMFVILL